MPTATEWEILPLLLCFYEVAPETG